jgi:hypothetical protein
VTKQLATILSSDVIGLLGRDVLVELLDVSRSGSLLRSPTPIPEGTLGTLTVDIDGKRYTDHVRVARCYKVSGAGERHHIGVEFLALRRPGQQSLRLRAAALRSEGAAAEVPVPLKLRLMR